MLVSSLEIAQRHALTEPRSWRSSMDSFLGYSEFAWLRFPQVDKALPRLPHALTTLSQGLGELTFLQLSTTYSPPYVAGHAVGYVTPHAMDMSAQSLNSRFHSVTSLPEQVQQDL
jgi:hypothetical protein